MVSTDRAILHCLTLGVLPKETVCLILESNHKVVSVVSNLLKNFLQ